MCSQCFFILLDYFDSGRRMTFSQKILYLVMRVAAAAPQREFALSLQHHHDSLAGVVVVQ